MIKMDMRVSLVPFGKEHVALTYKWVKNPGFRRLFLMRGEPEWEGHQIYFERTIADRTQCVYAIVHEGLHVGNCGLKNILPGNKEGELWIYVGESSMRGKGIGRNAAALLLRKGFKEMGLEMIYVNVSDSNEAALKMYEGLGFVAVPQRAGSNTEWTNRGCVIIRMELKTN